MKYLMGLCALVSACVFAVCVPGYSQTSADEAINNYLEGVANLPPVEPTASGCEKKLEASGVGSTCICSKSGPDAVCSCEGIQFEIICACYSGADPSGSKTYCYYCWDKKPGSEVRNCECTPERPTLPERKRLCRGVPTPTPAAE